jgi:hypothetical protein
MDPQETWHLICDALHRLKKSAEDEEARTDAVLFLKALARWLQNGGFPPSL